MLHGKPAIKPLPVRATCAVLWLGCLLLWQANPASAEEEPWPDFPEANLEQRLNNISDGELVFLPEAPDEIVHHHLNRIRILPASLQDGWVELEQCHHHLDQVSLLEIVYHPQRIRSIHILSSRNIEHSRVKDHSVELRGIQPAAQICIRAESQALHKTSSGDLQLRNGPYMRRFLDGYYPLHLSIEIDYPAQLLSLKSARPEIEGAPDYRLQPGRIRWETWFRGRLNTEFTFSSKQRP